MIVENIDEEPIVYFPTHLAINTLLKGVGEEPIEFKTNRPKPWNRKWFPVRFTLIKNNEYRLYSKKYKSDHEGNSYYDQSMSKQSDWNIRQAIKIDI